MTLEQAKDQVAKKHGFSQWDMIIIESVNRVKGPSEIEMLEEAAELYARSKWDEAATLTNRNIIHHTNLRMSDLPAKPEFK